MTSDNSSEKSRRVRNFVILAIMIVLLLVLYPQLQDFGSELYRFFG